METPMNGGSIAVQKSSGVRCGDPTHADLRAGRCMDRDRMEAGLKILDARAAKVNFVNKRLSWYFYVDFAAK